MQKPPRNRRGDGFAGQTLIVLPEPLREAARGHDLLRGLHVTDAGYFPSAAQHWVERPHGAPTSLVILCFRGAGWVRRGRRDGMVGPGDLVWLDAGEPHAYGAATEDPWTIGWVHFSGLEVPHWRGFLDACGAAEGGLFKLRPDRLDQIGLGQVSLALGRGLAMRHQLTAATALRSVFCRVGEALVERPGSRSARERVAASVEALRADWKRGHRLAELAATAGMSVTHYSAHFRALTGFAPIDYLMRQRVAEACRLLDGSDLTVADVAAAVGYADPYYFTRCFRRVMRCSPRQYRKVTKG